MPGKESLQKNSVVLKSETPDFPVIYTTGKKKTPDLLLLSFSFPQCPEASDGNGEEARFLACL